MMFKKKKNLSFENIVLKSRVAELENLICPCGQHDLVQVDYELVDGTGRGDETIMYYYQCRKCNKHIKSWKLLETKDGCYEGKAD